MARPARTLRSRTPAPDDALVEDAPDQVTLRFDEPVSASTGAVQVVSPSGGRIEDSVDEADQGRTLVVGIDGGVRGTYTVAYRVVSDDGHTITGSFVFHVGVRTGQRTSTSRSPSPPRRQGVWAVGSATRALRWRSAARCSSLSCNDAHRKATSPGRVGSAPSSSAVRRPARWARPPRSSRRPPAPAAGHPSQR
ncbi:copper resistance protein CopC (plasmid) [Iamia sp. SCSIO 61187]|nr:copper resistance protein CopC [Iamia sp. SCSIO 61187]